jgi:hypothetical protein
MMLPGEFQLGIELHVCECDRGVCGEEQIEDLDWRDIRNTHNTYFCSKASFIA